MSAVASFLRKAASAFDRGTPATSAAIVSLPESSPDLAPGASIATFATFAALAKATPRLIESNRNKIIAAREVNYAGMVGEDGYRLNFQELRWLADSADLIRLAIQDVKDTVAGLDWTLELEDGSVLDPKATALLQKPDGVNDWDAWAGMLLEEALVCDNVTLFPYFKGGRAVRLELIDGTTIVAKPDSYGRLPAPPTPAFVQSLTGVEYTTDELWYRPRNRRIRTLRGFSPTEQVAARAVINLNKVLRDMKRWLRGLELGGFLGTPEGSAGVPPMTLDQLQAYDAWVKQQLSNGIDGMVQVVAGSAPYKPVPPPRIDTDHEELLIRTIFRAFGSDPTGMVSKVNYSTADALQRWVALRGVRPWLYYLSAIGEEYLTAAGYPGHKLSWKAELEADDVQRKAQETGDYKVGLIGWEEMRQAAGRTTEEADTKDLRFFTVGAPAVPLPTIGKQPPPKPIPPQFVKLADGEQIPAEAAMAPETALKATRQELRRWETVVRKAVSAGKSPREFVTEIIPRWQQELIRKALGAGSGVEAFKARKFGKSDAKRAADSERMTAVLPTLQAATLAVIKQQAEHFAALAVEYAAKAKTTAEKATKLLPVHGPANVSVTVAEFRTLVRALYDAFSSGVDDSADLLGYGALSGTTAMDYAIQRAGELIGRSYSERTGTWIDNPNERWQLLPETRDRVDSVLQQGLDGQWTEKQLRDALGEVINDDARAAMIARTEGAMAYNEGTARNWEGQGVEWVKILDDEGPNSCAECEAANGQVWTMDEFLGNLIEHPNCVRAAVPAELGEEVGWGD